MRRDRAQLVLAAAAVLAVALAPVVFAYLQLGYHADVDATREYTAPSENAKRVLSGAVHEAAGGIPQAYAWSERSDAAETVRTRLAPRLGTLRAARVEGGTVYEISYNESAATDWATTPKNCPGGPNRAFGDCATDGGVVLQDRAGETHVVAVAFDVRVTTQRGRTDTTFVVSVI